jgi:hypothetical protein
LTFAVTCTQIKRGLVDLSAVIIDVVEETHGNRQEHLGESVKALSES